MNTSLSIVAPGMGRPYCRCRLCSVRLGAGADDDSTLGACGDCQQTFPDKVAALKRPSVGRRDRALSAADKSLIESLAGKVPEQVLLRLINARLADDLGAAAEPFTLAELRPLLPAAAAHADSWLNIRRLLASARRDGTLDQITPQVIADFAVVFGLSSGQLMRLRDLLSGSIEGGRHD